jgi:hypothetical protein
VIMPVLRYMYIASFGVLCIASKHNSVLLFTVLHVFQKMAVLYFFLSFYIFAVCVA